MDAVLSPARRRASEHLFFTALALAMATVVFIGFARSFFLRPWFPEAAAMAPPEPVPPLQFLAVPLTDMVLFGTFVTLAGLWRRDAQAHKRLMLLATANLIGAAAARIPLGIDPILAAFVVPDLLILTLAASDIRSGRRLHRVTLWAGAATILSQPVRLAVAETSGWLVFAEWATRLLS